MDEEVSMEYLLEQVMQKDLGKRLQVGQEIIELILDQEKSPELEQDQTTLDRMVDAVASSWVNSSNFKVRTDWWFSLHLVKNSCRDALEPGTSLSAVFMVLHSCGRMKLFTNNYFTALKAGKRHKYRCFLCCFYTMTGPCPACTLLV